MLGYRWLNSDRSWMYGLNAGYDSRSLMSTGDADTGVIRHRQEHRRFLPAACFQCRSSLKQMDIERLWTDPCR